MYDTIIIGAGPAGMTAAIYMARKRFNTLVLSKDIGGEMVWSNDIENYTGFSMISGVELASKFQEHMLSLKDSLEVKSGVEVVTLERNITSFVTEDSKGNSYYGKSVIIATGKHPKHLGVPGEKELYGHGVAVCATCDAPLFRGKTVAVVGGGNSAMDAALALAKFAAKVHIININDALAGDGVMLSKIESLPNVKIYNSSKTLEITGEKSVNGIRFRRFGKEDDALAVDGVFVEIGFEPCVLFDGLTKKDAKGAIMVDANLQSSVPGIFAAGDVNDAWGDQIIIAAGEGAKAAMSASDYLTKQR